jgi:hypothetical protein
VRALEKAGACVTGDDYFGGAEPARRPTVSETVNQAYARNPPRRERSVDGQLTAWYRRFLALSVGRMIAGFFDPL